MPSVADQIELLTPSDLEDVFQVSRQAIFKLRQRPDFPRPIFPFGTRTPRWRREDVQAFLDELAAQPA